jgi:hypothetical protein
MNTYFITTTIAGQLANLPALKSIKQYCKKHSAKLIILPANGASHMDSRLVDHLYYKEIRLNNNLIISNIKIQPTAVDPVNGLNRLGRTDSSFIFASPKQRLKLIASSSNLPHALITTGAITLSDYQTSYYKTKKHSFAEQDHICGGLIVEVLSSDKFNFRHVQFDSTGAFIDLCNKYNGHKITKEKPAAIVLGDLHSLDKDERAFAESLKQIKEYKPEEVVLHDVFDGQSVSHHIMNKFITRSISHISLEDELNILVKDLSEIYKLCKSITISKSNHDEFLTRYLEEMRYVTDSLNYKIAVELTHQMLNGIDPLNYYVSKKLPNLNWLSRNDSYKIANIECGKHGDKGASGSKGSAAQMNLLYGKSITGHSHSPEILRDSWVVGTLSNLSPEYTHGSHGSWLHSNCIIYQNGSRQMLNII